eukprot:1150109-Ditylum_brightwellii.AAC.1
MNMNELSVDMLDGDDSGVEGSELERNSKEGKLILLLVGEQPQRQESRSTQGTAQKDRLDKVTTRASHMEREADVKMEKFCLVVNIYFTLPQVVKHLRDNEIGVVETAMMRRGWPPPALQKIQ